MVKRLSKVKITLGKKTKNVKADFWKLNRTLFNKPYGTKYTKKEMAKFGFIKKSNTPKSKTFKTIK